MFVCYLDESGDTGTLASPTSRVQPVLCILALSLDLDRLRDFTFDFINLKTKFFPGRFPVHSNWLRRIPVAGRRSGPCSSRSRLTWGWILRSTHTPSRPARSHSTGTAGALGSTRLRSRERGPGAGRDPTCVFRRRPSWRPRVGHRLPPRGDRF